MQRTVLARRVGVAENTIYRIETGKRTPSVELLEKIAHELRTEPADLLKEPVPLGEAPLPVLDPWAMLAERDAPQRRIAALDVASDEERKRYVAELNAAIGRADLALWQDTSNPPTAEDEKLAHEVRILQLRKLRDYYIVLLNEAEPVVPPEPSRARELVPT
jgi:transcriptional regulator with XRE-family HTH domain